MDVLWQRDPMPLVQGLYGSRTSCPGFGRVQLVVDCRGPKLEGVEEETDGCANLLVNLQRICMYNCNLSEKNFLNMDCCR